MTEKLTITQWMVCDDFEMIIWRGLYERMLEKIQQIQAEYRASGWSTHLDSEGTLTCYAGGKVHTWKLKQVD